MDLYQIDSSFKRDGQELNGPLNARTYFHQPGHQVFVNMREYGSIWIMIDWVSCYYVLSCLLLSATLTGRRRNHTPFVRF